MVDRQYVYLYLEQFLEQFENKAKQGIVINRYKSTAYVVIKDILKFSMIELSD